MIVVVAITINIFEVVGMLLSTDFLNMLRSIQETSGNVMGGLWEFF
jgi:hypothetical protein